MQMNIFLILNAILFFFNISLFGFENDDAFTDSSNHKEVQLGILAGYTSNTSVSNAHGNHGNFSGSFDAQVEGIELEQGWAAGVNLQYYFAGNFGLLADILYLSAKFPDQEVILNSYPIHQPKSDLQLFTISAGPGYRYIGEGTWEFFNPYAAVSFAAILGYASDVNFTTTYGRGGYSAITGIGFNIQAGWQYRINKFVLLLEYRYEYLSSKVDYFRSFTEGLSFIKTTSYLLAGINYTL